MTYICLFIIIDCGFIVDHLISTNIVPVMFVLDPSYLSTIFSASITLAGFGIAVVSLLPNSFDKTYYGYSMKEIIRMKESNVSINTFIKVTFLCMAFSLLGLILVSYNLITAVFIFLLFINFNYFRKIFKIITNDLECEHIVTTYIETQSSRKDNPSLKDEINTHLLNYLSDLSKTSSTEQKDTVWDIFWTFNKEIWSKPSDNIKPIEQQINVCSDFTNKIINLFIPSVDSTLFTSYFKTILDYNALPSENKITLIEHGMSAIKVSDFITLSSMNFPKKIRDFKTKSNENFGIEDLYKVYIRNVIDHPNISQDEKIQLIANLFIVISGANNTETDIENESCDIEKKVLYDTVNNYLLRYDDLENAKIVLSSFISFIAEVKGYNSYRTYDISNEIAKIYATAIFVLFMSSDFNGSRYFLFDRPTTNTQKKKLYELFYEVSSKQTRKDCMFFDLIFFSNHTNFGWHILQKMTSWLSPSFWLVTDPPIYDDINIYYGKNTSVWAYIHIILYILYYHIRISTEPENVYSYLPIFDTYSNWELLSCLDSRNYKPVILNSYSIFEITNQIFLKPDFYKLFKKLLAISMPKQSIKLDFIKNVFDIINAEKVKYYAAPWISESFHTTQSDWISLLDPFQFSEDADNTILSKTFTLFPYELQSNQYPITKKELVAFLFKKFLPEIRSHFNKKLTATKNLTEIKENLSKLGITHCSFTAHNIAFYDACFQTSEQYRKQIAPLLNNLLKIDHEKWAGLFFFNKDFMKFYLYADVNVVKKLSENQIEQKIEGLPKVENKYLYKDCHNLLLTYEEAKQVIQNAYLEYNITFVIKTSISSQNSFRIDANSDNFYVRF